MEREALFALLASGLTWLAIVGASLLVTRRAELPGRREPAMWWRMVLPAYLGGVVLAFLSGWLLQEPDPSDERAVTLFYALAAVALLILLRALWRTVASIRAAAHTAVCVGTTGLLRPRVIVSRRFERSATPEALAAAVEHEAAHARARDPLRIVVARFCADLQWPMPAARSRLRAWFAAMEMDRDDQAVARGACPVALAEAIVLAARLDQPSRNAAVAAVAGASSSVALRVRRLLALDYRPHRRARRSGWPAIASAAVLGASVYVGLVFGDTVVGLLPGVLR